LPSFFAKSINDLLGDLVILNHIVEAEASKAQHGYVQHLSIEQQEIALNLMRGQQNHKRHQIVDAMRKAYGSCRSCRISVTQRRSSSPG
jgi:hypothetical protein